MKKNIYILSASDRFNYGDLLFPILVKGELSQRGDYDFLNIATVKSDFSEVGALPTYSFRSLYNKKNGGILFIAGGEVLCANWSRLLSFLDARYFEVYQRFDGSPWLEFLAMLLCGKAANPLPFVPSDPVLSEKYSVFYNAVGGVGVSESPLRDVVEKALSEAVYVSLREGRTFKEVSSGLGVSKARLSPDSAILVSNHYASCKNFSDERYVVFQVGRYKLGASLLTIKKELEGISRYFGCPVYLMPIGNCPGHEDNVPLKWLVENLNCPSKYIEPSSLSRIVEVISGAELFLGTSLHGVITAMSFNVPYVGLNPRVRKLDAYLKAWAPEPLSEVVAINDALEMAIKAMSIDKNELLASSSMQKRLASESFDIVHRLIQDI
ncbi:polysaccharide pyruvyl transferase family protein [Ectothiorhodospira shaposhnikovii]|uniref:polysaccharide pyruvyl transferase family protein n=1 Tax=Ectothiorhodospira shaposhnikovii TaxID=1054 RepID=UPI00399FF003